MQYKGEGSGETGSDFSLVKPIFSLQYENKNAHLVLCQCCVGTPVLPGESGSTVAASVEHSIPVTVAGKKGAPVRMENCANFSDSPPN